MSFLVNLRENLQNTLQDRGRIYSLMGIVVIVAAVVGNLLFVALTIMPQVQIWQERSAQLASVQQQLAARGSQEVDPESLKEQIAAAQAALNDAATIFLSDTQAAEVLNRLYQYASDSGVEIISLEAQPGPEERKDTYDVRTFRMEVKGAAPDLIDFVAQIEEAAYDAFIITSVVMAEGEDTHTLTMDIALYTSPYASEQIELPSPSPNATPTTTSSNLAELEEALAAAWASEEWEQAIDLVKEILIIDPSDDDMVDRLYMAYVNYGYHLLEKGDIAGATVQFNNALEITPEGAEALAGLEQVAVMLTPSPTTEELLAQQLDEAWAAENWEEVIGLIEQILAFNPGDEELTEKLYAAHINYGYKLADEGKLEEAKQEFSHALTIKPDGTEAIAGLQELAGGGEVSPTPISTPTPPQSQYTIYVVQRGDNLFRIALRFGTTAEAIKAANGLTSNIIHTGQQLRIPLQ